MTPFTCLKNGFTKISVAKVLRGDRASVSGSLRCTSNRGWLRLFIQLKRRQTKRKPQHHQFSRALQRFSMTLCRTIKRESELENAFFFTHNFRSSVRSSSSLSFPCLPTVLFAVLLCISLFSRLCLTSWTKGLTKSIMSVQHRQNEKTSSSSCSLVWGRGSLATWSSTDDSAMPKDDALRPPRRTSTVRSEKKRIHHNNNSKKKHPISNMQHIQSAP